MNQQHHPGFRILNLVTCSFDGSFTLPDTEAVTDTDTDTDTDKMCTESNGNLY